jgi:hypothetical protein
MTLDISLLLCDGFEHENTMIGTVNLVVLRSNEYWYGSERRGWRAYQSESLTVQCQRFIKLASLFMTDRTAINIECPSEGRWYVILTSDLPIFYEGMIGHIPRFPWTCSTFVTRLLLFSKVWWIL